MTETLQKETDPERDLGCHRRFVLDLERQLASAKKVAAERWDDINLMSKQLSRMQETLELASWNDWVGEMESVEITDHRLMREWFPVPDLAWHNVGPNNWRASWNNIEIGGYCAEPSEFRTGCAVWFGNTKFTTEILTAEEARNVICEKFLEWLRLGAATFIENSKDNPPTE